MTSPSRSSRTRAAVVGLALLCTAVRFSTPGVADDAPAARPAPAAGLADYLTTWHVDRRSRAVLEEGGGWTDAKQEAALRVLGRMARIPTPLAARWSGLAENLAALPAGGRVGDRLVSISGRATFVGELMLSKEEQTLAGRERADLVRVVTAAGETIDVLVDRVPKAWKRSVAIDEPTRVVGLPLCESAGPPTDADGGPAELLLAAASVGWFPDTLLGRLGMDYALFDSVADGQKLVAGDTEAFYGLLAAAGRAGHGAIESAAGPPVDMVPLIDPSRNWYADHRGAPVLVEGIARRATRIAVDDPVRKAQIGTDHYWEVFVFVPTPLIKINDRLQQDYPVVCCVRNLPVGMPTGQRIDEKVRIAGFAMKRYGYPLPDVQISSSQGDVNRTGKRQETALVVGREATWLARPNPAGAADRLGWIFLVIASVVGAALTLAAWSFGRDARRRERRSRDSLPDRIELP